MIFKNGKKVKDILVNGKSVVKMLSGGHIVYQKASPTPTTIGEFTINSNGDKVSFAPGNLQYQASTGLWRFAEHQWDYIGTNNAKASSSYPGWIDVYGYGCNGVSNGQNLYMPYNTNQNSSNYLNQSLSGTSDWGYLYNQQESANWRTLTKSEWNYILIDRSGDRFAKCIIDNTYKCLVIFPDGYNTTLINCNQIASDFTDNQITNQDALDLINAGCILLPAGGARNGTSTYNVGNYGLYWTSTVTSSRAGAITMGNGTLTVSDIGDRYRGFSVRLAQDVQ